MDDSWHVQIFQMTDVAAQELVASILARIDALKVESTQGISDPFVIIESLPGTSALSVRELVTSTDTHALLVHATTGPIESAAI